MKRISREYSRPRTSKIDSLLSCFANRESQVKGYVTHSQNGTYFPLCRKPQPPNKLIAFQTRTVGEWYHIRTPDRYLVFGLLLIRQSNQRN